MKALTDEDLRLNERAASIASSALGENVEAACRCEQVTQDQQLETFGVGAVNRGFVKGAMKLNRAIMPRMGSDMNQMQTGGLPKSFVLAVTATGVHALEDRENGPKVLKSWAREGFTARAGGHPAETAVSGVPEDRQLVILYLPLEGGKTKYMQAASNIVAASGSPGQPHRIMVAKDRASQAVIDKIATQGVAGANVVIGGQSLQSMMQAAAQPDTATQLTQLAALRDRGVLTDEEFAAEKAKILGS